MLCSGPAFCGDGAAAPCRADLRLSDQEENPVGERTLCAAGEGEFTETMKILIITNHSYMLYRFRKELIEHLQRKHEVVLSMPFVGHEEDFRAMGIRCIETNLDRRSINPQKDLALLRTYRQILRQEKPDLVITYSVKPNIYGGLASAMAGIPYCVNVQGLGTAFSNPLLAAVVGELYRVALRRASTVFFENEGDASEFVRRRIIPQSKVILLSGAGVNLADYGQLPYPRQNRFRFLFVGRIMKEKGVEELFAAMRRLHAAMPGQVMLDLVGFFDDQRDEVYKAQVQQLVQEGIAQFHGFQTDPRPYYGIADCVVLPSYHEGMSNVLLEAAASGRPLITSDVHGCREAVEPGVSGYLCRVADADSLYEQMLRMMQLTGAEREAMGAAGRRKMEQDFEKHMVVHKTFNAIFGEPLLSEEPRSTTAL